jgi:WD40 repeat protein
MLKIIFRLLFIFLLGAVSLVSAQSDGFDLPTDLYILLNEGIVQRYGLGAEGATTVTPEGDFVIDFAVAPDGNWIAYRTEQGITLAYMPNPDQIRVLLETVATADFPPLRQGGQTMAWSNDGTQLAYTTTSGVRVAFNLGTNQVVFANILTSPARHVSWSPNGTYLAIEVEDNIWWIYQHVGDEMILVGALPSSYGTAWQDDTRLIFAPQEGGLIILDFGNFNEQYPLREDGQRYFLPTIRPDGSLVAFASDNDEDPQANAAWTRMSVAGNIATIDEFANTPTDITGAMWGVGGELLIALRDGGMTLLIPNVGVVLPLPIGEVVAYGWGAPRPPSARGLVMSQQGFFRANDIFGVTQVWQLPNDGTPPTAITTGENEVTAYTVNPTGTILVYISQNQLWRIAIGEDGAEPIELTRRLSDNPQDIIFSPDESQVFYVTEGADGGLWAVDSMGESAPTLLLPNEEGATYRYPQFAPNVNGLIIAITRPERATEYNFYDPTAEATLNIGNYTVAGWLPDGKVAGYVSQSIGLTNFTSQLQLLDLSQDPILPATVWEADQTRLLDFQPITAENWMLVVADVVPYGTEKGVLLEYADGVFSIKVELGTMIDPVLSPDGLFLAWLTRPNGLLIIYDITTGERTLLQAPNGVQDFRWGGAEGKKFNEL